MKYTLANKLTGFYQIGFDYWFFFFVVLILGRGSEIVGNFDPRVQPFSFLFLILCLIVLIYRTWHVSTHKNWLLIFTVLLSWSVYHYFDDSSFEYGNYILFIINASIGLFMSYYYKDRLIEYFYKIAAFLSAISIPFWLFSVFAGINTLAQYAPLEHWINSNGSSFLIYTTLEKMGDFAMTNGIVRNAGYAWEPGRFACINVLALSCYIVYNQGAIKWKSWQFISLLFGVLSSLSTTGYSTLIVLLLLYFNVSTKITAVKRTIVLLGLIFTSIFVFDLPFMQEKILNNLNEDNWITNRDDVQWIEDDQVFMTVDRTEGLVLDYLNLEYKPFMGCGLSYKDTYIYTFISQYLTTSNGLLYPLSHLGLLIGLPYFILYFVGMYRMSKFHMANGAWILLFISLIIQYSYNFMFDILFFSFAFYGLLSRKQVSISDISDSSV